jgi:hypothetical protein
MDQAQAASPTPPARWYRPFEPVDAASLAVFRIAFGFLMLWEVLHFFSNGLLASLFVEPAFLFKFYGFEWVRPWPGVWLYVHFAVLGVLSILIMIGLWYRVAVALFAVGFTYVFLLDQGLYLNHFYLICLVSLLMAFVPANRAWSIDGLKHQGRPATVPAWSLWLLRWQFGIVYVYAGLAKLNGEWFHGEPMRSFLANLDGSVIIGPYAETQAMIWCFTIGGLLFDLLVVPLLLWRRTRLFAFAAALFFHVNNMFLFNIDVFPWFMIAATTLFLSPDWPKGLMRRWRPAPTVAAPVDTAQPGTVASRRKVVLTLIGVYLAVQLLVPMRHFLYPGNAQWTEEGNRFAWHMLLSVKRTEVRFQVTDVSDEKVWIVDPADFLPPQEVGLLNTSPTLTAAYMLTLAMQWRENGYDDVSIRRQRLPVVFQVTDPLSGEQWTMNPVDLGLPPKQARRMSGTPDMVAQFAHFIARRMHEAGHAAVEVRVNGLMSLHGREYQHLIDPGVDLAAEPRTLGHARWIRPLEKPFPRR